MYFSKHNIFSKISESDNYYLVNPLSGNADIITADKAEEIQKGTYTDIEEYKEKGYLIDESEEEKIYKNSYLNFLDNRDDSEIQIFFVPWYTCNFRCTYCYQEGYSEKDESLSQEVMDSFFSYVNKEFAGKKKYITVFGGEPLLPGEKSKAAIDYFVTKAGENNLDLAFVTNGYSLEEYIPILKKGHIREIQITVDGPEVVHNKRRPLAGGKDTFKNIVNGIDKSLEAGFAVNLRTVVDKENMNDLVQLADYAIEKGWTANPLFKTQLGRNYELHFCQSDQNKLYDRVSLYRDLYQLIVAHPQLIQYHRPAYSISKFIFENGDLPEPLFDSCPACKTEWAFDFTGRIYSCTATVGKEGESLGTYYPVESRREEIIEQWESRDVTTIDKCHDCSLQLACGGGCGSVAKNNHSGEIHSPDCRPVKELLEMGISLYFEKGVIEND
ncbi:MAG: radical SAM protein [Spirochaetaceae bacterium]|nr:radical SAM protein [Spirochaetaceae bacterium]